MYAGDSMPGKAVKSFYEKSMAKVRMCREEDRSFEVTV